MDTNPHIPADGETWSLVERMRGRCYCGLPIASHPAACPGPYSREPKPDDACTVEASDYGRLAHATPAAVPLRYRSALRQAWDDMHPEATT